MTENVFGFLNSSRIGEIVSNAKQYVCYAAPGIHIAVASAMVDVARRLGPEMLIVSVDFDERVMRMGYGDFESTKRLRDARVLVNHAPGLRSALIIVDGEGHTFTPTPLYLEAEPKDETVRNSMRLSAEQVGEALARLSPAAKAIAIAQARDVDERERISAIPIEVDSRRIDDQKVAKISEALEVAPPVEFDLARQVRVYESYLQYVDLKLDGAAIHRRRFTIPPGIQNLGNDTELEGRLRTTFDLLRQSDEFSSKALEDELNDIRKNFTRSLGGDQGRVLLKRKKELFESRLDDLRSRLKRFRDQLEQSVGSILNTSREQIADHYVANAMKSPSDGLLAQCIGAVPTADEARRWLLEQLDRTFPTVETLLNEIELKVQYKDVTYETLNAPDFLDQVKRAFPAVDWDRAHEEFTAAAEARAAR